MNQSSQGDLDYEPLSISQKCCLFFGQVLEINKIPSKLIDFYMENIMAWQKCQVEYGQ